MLRLQLTPYSDNVTWQWSGACYRTLDTRSYVEPYEHPMVEHVAATDGSRTMLMVRERVATRPVVDSGVRILSPAEYNQAHENAIQWSIDYVLIETAPDRPVTVHAGMARTTPLYLADDGRGLYGSWDMADLAAHVIGIDAREAARLLIYRPRYSSDTLFRGIRRLTERATAHFGDHLWISYPKPALHARSRELTPNADVLTAFVHTMDEAMDRRPWAEPTTLFHLTGGLDSGSLATRAAERYPGIFPTSTLVVGGPGRQQQLQRRAKMRSALPFADTDLQVDAMTTLPLAPACVRSTGLISPYEEPIHYPFAKMARAVADTGAHTVVTGLGGDEMVALAQEERIGDLDYIGPPRTVAPWIGQRSRTAIEYLDDAIAPPAMVNSMTLLSLETTAPTLLREGLWPLHPFTDPALVQFGEMLPFDWRDLKQLQRRRLASLGLSEDVVNPQERESFAEVVEEALNRHGVKVFTRMLDQGSALIDEELVDPDGLRAALTDLESGSYREDRHASLLQVATLHLAVEAFLCRKG